MKNKIITKKKKNNPKREKQKPKTKQKIPQIGFIKTIDSKNPNEKKKTRKRKKNIKTNYKNENYNLL